MKTSPAGSPSYNTSPLVLKAMAHLVPGPNILLTAIQVDTLGDVW